MRQHILRLIYGAAETSDADVIAVNQAPMIEFIDCGLYEGDKHGTFLRVSRDRLIAAGKMLTAILSHAPKNGLTAE